MKIISNCPLCEEHSLHVIEEDNIGTQQCINCGYATSTNFIGTRKDNETYKTLPEEMQSWSVENDGRIWIPSMITLPFGTLYPENIDGEMKWAIATMIDIPEEEQKNYPAQNGSFYTRMYDTEGRKVFDTFLGAMNEMNEEAKRNAVPETKIKLPKLTRVDG